MDSTDNSNDDNDLEVATVLASALKENIFSSGLNSLPNSSIPRSSTVLTNLPRGNSVNLSHLSGVSSPSVYELAAKGELSAIKRVLQHSGSEKLSSDGRKPLLAAARNNWANIVEFLLSQGESVNAMGEGDTTALHQAASKGNSKIIEILLKFGPDVNAKCSRGNTPLHYAIYSKDCNCISMLLHAGADVTIPNGEGLTSIEYAYKQNCKDVENTFQKHLLSMFEM